MHIMRAFQERMVSGVRPLGGPLPPLPPPDVIKLSTDGNKLQAARLLAITPRALRLRLREQGLAVMTSGARDEDDAIAPG
jgi:hypothetical protein